VTDLPASTVTGLADGRWHRLHPATPFLRGGITFVAIAGFVLVQFRDVVLNMLTGGPDDRDPLLWISEHGYVGLALLGVLVVLALVVGGFYLSWRASSFRITDEVVEVRRGLVNRSHRRARLDRVQGVAVQRPFLARLFGAARLEVDVAGHDANVRLEYLGGAAADGLRRDILLLASGARAQGTSPVAAGSALDQRVAELLAPELDPALAAGERVVTMHAGRLLGSIVLSGSLVWLLVFTVGPVVAFGRGREIASFAVVIPGLIALFGFVSRRLTRSLRYTIAATDDGIRIGYGLFSTNNETLPPGRIHAIELAQPLLWRPLGWWRIRINRASNSRQNANQSTTTVLPVGDLADVERVLALMLPEAAGLADALVSRGGDGFTVSPRRARVLRPFSLRRNGFALRDGLVLLRRGWLLRTLVIVPLARAQSVSLAQGPLDRRLRLAEVRLHTVPGPVAATLGALDEGDAALFGATVSGDVVTAIAADRAHRWREGGAATA
jgi:putative membrane protein